MHLRRLTARFLPAAALALTLTAVALAGGFQLSVEQASSSGSEETLLIVRTKGCDRPEDVRLDVHAEGWVDGRRVQVPVRLDHVARGVYGIKRQWPAGGAWVLAVQGRYNGQEGSVLVTLDETRPVPDFSARVFHRTLRTNEIEQAIAGLARGD